MDQQEVILKEYEIELGLYKHYLELVLKFLGFYHVAVGAFLSFYFTRSEPGLLRYALWFPAIASVVFAGVLCYGANRNALTRAHVQQLAQALGFGVWPELNVLSVLLYVSAGLLVLWAVGCVLLFCYSGQLFKGISV